MKRLLLTICIGIVGIGNAQNVYIPDTIFKAYLVGEPTINTNGDTEIQVSEAAAFSRGISLSEMSISDLIGIEAFTALTYLDCGDIQLTSLDVTKNTALTYLECRNNKLKRIDVTNNTALTYLYCEDNKLRCVVGVPQGCKLEGAVICP